MGAIALKPTSAFREPTMTGVLRLGRVPSLRMTVLIEIAFLSVYTNPENALSTAADPRLNKNEQSMFQDSTSKTFAENPAVYLSLAYGFTNSSM